MSKYLKTGRHLVYLDQCVISRFLPKPENEPWHELRDLIIRGHSSRRIICPLSLEHLVETCALPDNEAILIDDLLWRLSSGWSLAPEPRLIAWQIVCRLRGLKVVESHFLQKGLWRSLRTPGAIEQLRKIREGMDVHNAWMMQGVNEINGLVRDGKRGDAAMRSFLVQRRTRSYVDKLAAELLKVELSGKTEVVGSEHNSKAAYWPSLVVFCMAKENRLRLKEITTALHLLRTEMLEFIPTLKVKAELEAIQFFHREKIEPRDQYDVTRAACALPFADVFITDGGKASAIRELRLDSRFRTRVFSMKRSELPLLVSELKQIAGAKEW